MLDEYRSSFHIYILGPATPELKRAQSQLEKLGYVILHFDSLSEALSEISTSPPHFAIFSDRLSHKDLISILATMSQLLPETHFLTFGTRTAEFPPPQLFDMGLEAHIESGCAVQELKKTFDQRVQLDLSRYIEEQKNQPEVKFSDYLRAVRSENPLAYFMSNMTLPNPDDVLFYLRYFSARHVLAVIGGKGRSSFDGLGIDLSMDSKFQLGHLANPNEFELLQEFVHDTLDKEYFEARTVGYQNEPVGLLVLASDSPECKQLFQDQWVDALEMIYSLQFVRSRLQHLDHYCPETEALSFNGFSAEAKKEVVRSRRLEKPTSLIVLQVDHWRQQSEDMNPIQRKNWLRALYRFLVRHSRINDCIGRLDDGSFGVLLPHTPAEGAKIKADRLRELIEDAELKVGGQVKKFTLSCGVSEYPRISTDSDTLLQTAMNVVAEHDSESNRSYLAPFLARGSVDFEV